MKRIRQLLIFAICLMFVLIIVLFQLVLLLRRRCPTPEDKTELRRAIGKANIREKHVLEGIQNVTQDIKSAYMKKKIYKLLYQIEAIKVYKAKYGERYKEDEERGWKQPQSNRYIRLLKALHVVENATILVTGLAKDVDRRIRNLEERLSSLLCCLKSADFFVLESSSTDHSRSTLEKIFQETCPSQLPRAGKLIYQQSGFIPVQEKPPTIERDRAIRDRERVRKLTRLRMATRSFTSFKHAIAKYDAVILMDFDMLQISRPEYLLFSLATLMSKQLQVLCAHGRGLGDYYYDSFATVLSDNSFLYPPQWRKVPHLFPGERDIWTEPGLTLEDFSLEVDAALKQGDGLYRVKSCFGGFSYYSASSFFNVSCHYDSKRVFVDDRFYSGFNETCEHVALNLCLCNSTNNCAISSELETFWDGWQYGEYIRDKEQYQPSHRYSFL
eukprot:TRINITY_DN4603_c0_g1_i1.p1 TRINITY_DN4603_c0_g1~~TRINITY_DN4603_c0_g1_i1.p1  ORF type:complete len:442 (-),score=41.57 TRINITY_DN4603_c0_g1_i1:884-2209(-)